MHTIIKTLWTKKITFHLISENRHTQKNNFFRYSTNRERLMFRHLILENLLETLESAITRMKEKEVKFDRNDETQKVFNMNGLQDYYLA